MISTIEAAKKLKISARRVRILCQEGRIDGAQRIGATWVLPDKPVVQAAARRRPGKVKMKD